MKNLMKVIIICLMFFPSLSFAKHSRYHVLVEQAKFYMQDKDYDRAESTYRKILRKYRYDPDMHSAIARIKTIQGKHQEAEEIYREVLRKYPKYEDALFGLGRSLMNQKRYDESREVFQKLISLKPENTLAKKQLSNIDYLESVDKDKYTISTNFRVDDYDYTNTGYHSELVFYFMRPRNWGIHAGILYDDKFTQKAGSFTLGGTYFLDDKTYMDLTGYWSHESVVVPRQSYEAWIHHLFGKNITMGLGYRFKDHDFIYVHSIMADLMYQFDENFDVALRYGYSIMDLPANIGTNHSVSAKATYWVHKKVRVYGGYAWGEESYEIFTPPIMREFSSHYLFSGIKWEFLKGLSTNFDFSYENRNTGRNIYGYNLGFSYTW